jgi:hypothetical protein
VTACADHGLLHPSIITADEHNDLLSNGTVHHVALPDGVVGEHDASS